jgi:hypothetical protein
MASLIPCTLLAYFFFRNMDFSHTLLVAWSIIYSHTIWNQYLVSRIWEWETNWKQHLQMSLLVLYIQDRKISSSTTNNHVTGSFNRIIYSVILQCGWDVCDVNERTFCSQWAEGLANETLQQWHAELRLYITSHWDLSGFPHTLWNDL